MGDVLKNVVDDSGYSINSVFEYYSRRTPYSVREKGWRQKGKETIVYLKLSLRSVIR